MPNFYHLDLAQFSLEKFRRTLETAPLLPSQQILKEQISARFARLQAAGFANLQDLTTALSSKKKLEQLAQTAGLPVEYLTILKRRLGIYTPKPLALKELPGLAAQTVKQLAALGMQNTEQLWPRALTRRARAELAQTAKLSLENIREVACLSDLARAPYVGPAFARLLYASGITSLAKLAAQKPDALYQTLSAVNAEQKLYKAALPKGADLAAWLELVKDLPIAFEE